MEWNLFSKINSILFNESCFSISIKYEQRLQPHKSPMQCKQGKSQNQFESYHLICTDCRSVQSLMHNAYVSACFAQFCTRNFRLISFISCDWLTFYVEIFCELHHILFMISCIVSENWNQYDWEPHINYDGSPNSLLHWPFVQFMCKINKQFANGTQWIKRKIETKLKTQKLNKTHTATI